MTKKFAYALLVLTAISTAALAVDVTPPAGAVPAAAPSAAASHGLSKTDWDAMSKADKIKFIDQKHAATIAKSDAHWKSLTDDQKIAQYEKRRASYAAWQQKKATATTPNAAAATPAAPAKQ